MLPDQLDVICDDQHAPITVLSLVRTDGTWRPFMLYVDAAGDAQMLPSERGGEVWDREWKRTSAARIPVVTGLDAEGMPVAADDPSAVGWSFDLRCPICKVSPRLSGKQMGELANLMHTMGQRTVTLQQIVRAQR